MKRLIRPLFLAVATLLATSSVQAELRLPSIFGHHMVLQRDQENPIWGWAEAGAKVEVTFSGETSEATADEDGRWETTLASLPGSNHALTLKVRSGDDEILLSNIVMGEVWLCSGQSNMGWPVTSAYDPDLEIATANYPNIRLITVPRVGTQELRDDFDGQWEICTPKTVGDFSAVGYFYGRLLHQTLGVPIGLIDNAWGGSAAEAWVARDVLEADDRFDHYIKKWEDLEANYDYEAELAKWKKEAAELRAEGKRPPRAPRDHLGGQHRPGNLWAGVLHPIIGYGIRGTIWYQGESNASRAWQYDDLFGLMISEWREAWGQGDFPFYWVQLADFMEERENPGESAWAELREAQSNTLSLPNTGQAVIYDLGEGRDIHPRDKQNVARRLARIALARDYGRNIPHQSPSYESMSVEGDEVTLTFENVGAGLYSFDTKTAHGFAVAGEDREWHTATGEVTGDNTVVVSSPDEQNPVAVRYAWADNPVANLMSRVGLPVVPFRTDDWPQTTDPSNKEAVSEE